MKNLVYNSWFRESLAKNQPWNVCQKLCLDIGHSFKRIIHPGDTRYDNFWRFSLSALRERTSMLLRWIDENTMIVSYSFAALPTLWAVADNLELIRSKIDKLVFLHPADNLPHSVAAMHWALKKWKENFLWEDHFLNSDPESSFDTVIGDWNGDPTQFQKDLQECSRSPIDIASIVTSMEIPFSIIRWENDVITNKRLFLNSDFKFTEALRNHIPDLSRQRFIY